MGKSPKHIALLDETEETLWQEAENAARREHDATQANNGTVLAQIAAAYVGIDGPLEDHKDA